MPCVCVLEYVSNVIVFSLTITPIITHKKEKYYNKKPFSSFIYVFLGTTHVHTIRILLQQTPTFNVSYSNSGMILINRRSLLSSLSTKSMIIVLLPRHFYSISLLVDLANWHTHTHEHYIMPIITFRIHLRCHPYLIALLFVDFVVYIDMWRY